MAVAPAPLTPRRGMVPSCREQGGAQGKATAKCKQTEAVSDKASADKARGATGKTLRQTAWTLVAPIHTIRMHATALWRTPGTGAQELRGKNGPRSSSTGRLKEGRQLHHMFCALDGHACCCSDRPAASSLSAGNCTHAQCTSHAGERNTEVLVQAAIQQRKRPLHAPGLARSRTADIRSIKSSEQERVLLCEPTSPLGLCDLFLLVLHFLLLRTSADLRRCYSST